MALDGRFGALALPPGARFLSQDVAGVGAVLVIEADAPEVTLRIGPAAP